MIKINSIKEKEEYFASTIKKHGAYFNVTYHNGDTEFIWVTLYERFNEDGSNWYLEAPNDLRKYKYSDDSLELYYDEEDEEWYDSPYLHMHIEGEFAYEVDSPQTAPFLPESFEIEFITDDCKEAAKYMLENRIL
ncbi:hypothetical protein QH639_18075 [Lysinibacillus sp. 1 U-2021]|uniref:hypothetical protein n=1 Tax=Lysinibacillus sp. 1 U-2021 TaxID=3039426 RepID=UPI002480680D|nr:hypothetical protein [Lysinibacillus sp. 1 U-2021]WGT37727.1 hypothetical protein QH639_18075 [Lysinibacillus sp. 1 U-2021]